MRSNSATVVRTIGRTIPVDDRGRIVNPCHHALLKAPWTEAIDTALALIRMSLDSALHSVYLRGSVPRGTAIERVSDLDLVCVLSAPVLALSPSWAATLDARIRRHHPCCAGIDIRVVSQKRLTDPERSANLRFLLKTQGLCIHGRDLTAEWRPFTLNDARIALKALPASLAAMRELLHRSSGVSPEELTHRCRWIMKKIVRAGFELVAEREQAYTRDLYPCWNAFNRHHPDMGSAMYAVLLLAIEPRPDSVQIEESLRVGDWVLSISCHTEH